MSPGRFDESQELVRNPWKSGLQRESSPSAGIRSRKSIAWPALRCGGLTIDFGVGVRPTPDIVRKAVQAGVDARASAGYPSYVGDRSFRAAVAAWMEQRFNVRLDPETEVCATIGSKEAVFNFPNAILDPGDVVLCPSPGYPPYNRGTLFAGGEPWYYPVTMENGFLPNLDAIPADVLARARMIWVNYPNLSRTCQDVSGSPDRWAVDLG